ncbi:MAG: VOC family protein [Phenylobacterium sp.]|nr:VOC family protein [Phenylobacterium sp.]
MKLRYTIFYVDDVQSSVAFYRQAFGLDVRRVHGAGDYVELETGATSLSFCSRKLMDELGKPTSSPAIGAPTFEIAFETDDVGGAFQRAVANGAKTISAPESMPWGQTVSYVADPDGYLVEICSPVSPP